MAVIVTIILAVCAYLFSGVGILTFAENSIKSNATELQNVVWQASQLSNGFVDRNFSAYNQSDSVLDTLKKDLVQYQVFANSNNIDAASLMAGQIVSNLTILSGPAYAGLLNPLQLQEVNSLTQIFQSMSIERNQLISALSSYKNWKWVWGWMGFPDYPGLSSVEQSVVESSSEVPSNTIPAAIPTTMVSTIPVEGTIPDTAPTSIASTTQPEPGTQLFAGFGGVLMIEVIIIFIGVLVAAAFGMRTRAQGGGGGCFLAIIFSLMEGLICYILPAALWPAESFGAQFGGALFAVIGFVLNMIVAFAAASHDKSNSERYAKDHHHR